MLSLRLYRRLFARQITSVGATQSFAPEVSANLSSGGFSNYFPTPSYQLSAVQSYIANLGGTYKGLYNAS
jgi:tripeptidyl-peptidase-1